MLNQENSEINKCESGAYIVKITSHDSNVTLVTSGSEVELALKVQKSLKDNNIDSKVISMPCMELFENQSEDYKKKLFDEDALVFTLEAGSIFSWQKYKGDKGYRLWDR